MCHLSQHICEVYCRSFKGLLLTGWLKSHLVAYLVSGSVISISQCHPAWEGNCFGGVWCLVLLPILYQPELRTGGMKWGSRKQVLLIHSRSDEQERGSPHSPCTRAPNYCSSMGFSCNGAMLTPGNSSSINDVCSCAHTHMPPHSWHGIGDPSYV